jgi:hypothetical protein
MLPRTLVRARSQAAADVACISVLTVSTRYVDHRTKGARGSRQWQQPDSWQTTAD